MTCRCMQVPRTSVPMHNCACGACRAAHLCSRLLLEELEASFQALLATALAGLRF